MRGGPSGRPVCWLIKGQKQWSAYQGPSWASKDIIRVFSFSPKTALWNGL